MSLTNLIAAFAVVFMVFACADDNTGKAKTQELVAGATLAGTEWVLTGYKNAPLEEGLHDRSTIKFSSGTDADVLQVTGRSFINGYQAKFRIEESEGTVSVVDGIWTTKVGGSVKDMQAEKFYISALGNVKSIRINDNNQLELYFGDSDEVAYFNEK